MSIKIQTVNMKTVAVTLANAPSGTPISADQIFTTDFIIYFGAANAGDVYGPGQNPDNTWIPKAAGTSWRYTAGEGNVLGIDSGGQFNLNQLLLNGTDGDTAIVEYLVQEATVQ